MRAVATPVATTGGMVADLQFTVLLEPDEDDPCVYSASVSGFAGRITTVGPPELALSTVRTALERLVLAVGPEDAVKLAESQRPASPGSLPPGSRLESITISVTSASDAIKVSA